MKWNSERIPSERSWWQAFLELLQGEWMRMYMVYRPAPEAEGVCAERDLDSFKSTQMHISLLATLLLDVCVGLIGERGDMSSFTGMMFTVFGLISATLFFLSAFSSIVSLVLISQANSDTEARFLLLCFAHMSVRPFQLWLSGIVTIAMALPCFVIHICIDPPIEEGTSISFLGVTSGEVPSTPPSPPPLTASSNSVSYTHLTLPTICSV